MRRGRDVGRAVEYWRTLHTDHDAEFDAEVVLDATTLTPM
jgi:3-isopropylmalate/(R)-2-methylmalate dehydratase large subunit